MAPWQIALLDWGHIWLPAAAVASLVVFPWGHWNRTLDAILAPSVVESRRAERSEITATD